MYLLILATRRIIHPGQPVLCSDTVSKTTHTPVIPAFIRWKNQECKPELESETSMGSMRPYLKITVSTKWQIILHW